MKCCPLCMKNGVISRIKAFQINLEEAIWSCERIDCIWPFGYQDPICFQRSAITCNWNDSYFKEDSMSTLSELSLYTPPMTPREDTFECSANSTMEDKFSESISSKKQSITDCNRSPFELTNNKFIKERNISRHVNKQMPEIINIEKVNIDISKFFQSKHLDNERIQESQQVHLHPTSVIDTAIDSGTLYTDTKCDFSSHTQCKTEKEQSKSDTAQASATVTCLDTNSNINIPAMTTNPEDSMNITNNLNTTNCVSILDTLGTNDTSLDRMLNNILDEVSDITERIDDNFIDFIYNLR